MYKRILEEKGIKDTCEKNKNRAGKTRVEQLNISKLWCRERKYRGKCKEKTKYRVVTERDTANENQFVLFEIESERRSNWLKALYESYSKNTALESLAIACTITRINMRALRQKIFSLSQ